MIHEDLSGISLIAVESFNLLVVRCVFVVGCTVLYYHDGWVFRIFIFSSIRMAIISHTIAEWTDAQGIGVIICD